MTPLGTQDDNMFRVLVLHREKTRVLNKEDKDRFGVSLFLKHCQNVSDVISPTGDIANSLFGEICGGCVSNEPTSSSSSSSSWQPPLTSIQPTYETQSKKKKFSMNWNVQIDPGFLPDNKIELNLCRKANAFLHGIPQNSLKSVSSKMKDVNSSG
jgi:hypothetical protein